MNFELKRERMPHYSTCSRVLGHAVEASEVEQLIGQFFMTDQSDAEPQRGSIQLALDGLHYRRDATLREDHAQLRRELCKK